MRVVGAEEIHRLLDYPRLIDAIEQAFAAAATAPARHHHRVPRGKIDPTLILMPAWEVRDGGFLGVKVVSVFPDNALRRKPTVMGTYLLLAGDSGEPLAALDGAALTLRRTAAASALASRYLSRTDSRRLTMIGAGALAPRLIAAHATVRQIADVTIWNRTPAKAEALATEIEREGLAVRATTDLEAAVKHADIVSVATMTDRPILQGKWLAPGAHIDLVGAYTPAMRESDDDAIRRCRIFVDTRIGMRESGDIAQPLGSGVISESDIAADLHDLARSRTPARRSADEITLFKSVGNAIEDLAAAVVVWKGLNP